MIDSDQDSQYESEYYSNFLFKLEDLKKIRDLDIGPNGYVSLYENQKNSSKIAIKSYNLTITNKIECNTIVQNEMKKLINLQHQCILPILGYSTVFPEISTELEKLLLIGRKYAKNSSLSKILKLLKIKECPSFIDNTWITITIIGIISGMKYLHSKQMIHGNLKPNNIIIDDDGFPLISDFEYNKFVDLNLISSNDELSLPLYSAPEIIKKESNYSQLVDSYSFSLILFELLVGSPVFPKNKQLSDLIIMINDGIRPDIPKNVHPVLKDIITKCWSASPNERLTFEEIYTKLNDINFQIMPNVDISRIEEYIQYTDSLKNINIRLFNGKILSLYVNVNDKIYDLRQKISLITKIPLELVIPSLNGNYLVCCWKCTLGKTKTLNSLFKCNHSFLENPFIDLCFRFTAKYISDDYSPLPTETLFFIPPKTMSDLFTEITSKYRNLWFLDKCKIKVFMNHRKQIYPSNRSIFEMGIQTGSHFNVINDWNKTITIDRTPLMCNLDDPIHELIFRYLLRIDKNIDKLPYLEKNGTKLNDINITLRDAGIEDGDNLQCIFIESDISLEINILSEKRHYETILKIPPNETLGKLKRTVLAISKINIPLGAMSCLQFSYSFENDNRPIMAFQNIINGSTLIINRKYWTYFDEFQQY